MEAAGKLHRVCQAWWNQLAETPGADSVDAAREFLRLLDWPDPMLIDTSASPIPATSFLIQPHSGPQFAVHFTRPRALEPPSSMVEKGLDYCQTTRLLANGTRKLSARYALITDFARFYFYDVYTDELLLHADSAEGFTRELAPLLTQAEVDGGSIDEMRRSPRSFSARQLRQWCGRWAETLMLRCSDQEEHALLMLDRLFVLRALYDSDVLKPRKWSLRERFSEVVEVAFGARHQEAGKALTALFHDLCFEWNLRLFRPIPDLDKALDESGVAAPLLREFTLLSKSKFALSICLESFNYGDPLEKARVRIVPENDEDRDDFVTCQTASTIDYAQIRVDLLDDGYRAILYWFDRLAEVHERIAVELADERVASHAHKGLSSLEKNLDLFSWSDSSAATAPDSIRRIAEQGLVIYYASPRQYRTARLLMYLHVIDHYRASEMLIDSFPQVESALQPRPKHLDTTKKYVQFMPEDDIVAANSG